MFGDEATRNRITFIQVRMYGTQLGILKGMLGRETCDAESANHRFAKFLGDKPHSLKDGSSYRFALFAVAKNVGTHSVAIASLAQASQIKSIAPTNLKALEGFGLEETSSKRDRLLMNGPLAARRPERQRVSSDLSTLGCAEAPGQAGPATHQHVHNMQT